MRPRVSLLVVCGSTVKNRIAFLLCLDTAMLLLVLPEAQVKVCGGLPTRRYAARAFSS